MTDDLSDIILALLTRLKSLEPSNPTGIYRLRDYSELTPSYTRIKHLSD